MFALAWSNLVSVWTLDKLCFSELGGCSFSLASPTKLVSREFMAFSLLKFDQSTYTRINFLSIILQYGVWTCSTCIWRFLSNHEKGPLAQFYSFFFLGNPRLLWFNLNRIVRFSLIKVGLGCASQLHLANTEWCEPVRLWPMKVVFTFFQTGPTSLLIARRQAWSCIKHQEVNRFICAITQTSKPFSTWNGI